MRVLLDACVLFPTVLREVLLGVAEEGAYDPLWSERILEEWARAVAGKLPGQEGIARAEIALLRDRWPTASVEVDPAVEARLNLPDPADNHVLAAAIAGQAEVLVTLNLSDFPTRHLAAEGVLRLDPDHFLLGLWQDQPDLVAGVCGRVHAKAEALSGTTMPKRGLLKRAKLPRLGKALG